MKKIIRKIALIILTLISIAVIYTIGYRAVFTVMENRAVKTDTQIDFSQAGNGLTWILPNADKTLFFIPSSEEAAVEGLYGDWLRELHSGQGVNIIVPPVDTAPLDPSITGSAFDPAERTRNVLFFYNLYSSIVGKNHEITVMATGDGSIQAFELARSGAAVEKYVLLSPAHGDRTNRGSLFFLKIASITFLNHLMPWLPESYGKNRSQSYDILNDELNELFSSSSSRYYPAFINTSSMRNVNREVRRVHENLPLIKPNRFFIIYGDDDLSYSLEGFERLGDALKAGGSEVTIMRINSSGRMLLFDNGRGRILDLLSILLQ